MSVCAVGCGCSRAVSWSEGARAWRGTMADSARRSSSLREVPSRQGGGSEASGPRQSESNGRDDGAPRLTTSDRGDNREPYAWSAATSNEDEVIRKFGRELYEGDSSHPSTNTGDGSWYDKSTHMLRELSRSRGPLYLREIYSGRSWRHEVESNSDSDSSAPLACKAFNNSPIPDEVFRRHTQWGGTW